MAEFVTITEDRFEKTTTYATDSKVKFDSSSKYGTLFIKFRRIVSPSSDELQINILGVNLGKAFLDLVDSKGPSVLDELEKIKQSTKKKPKAKLAMIIGNDVVRLEQTSVKDDDSDTRFDWNFTTTKEVLKSICDASSLDVRVTLDDDNQFEFKEPAIADFKLYAQKCYNGFYDSSAYKEAEQAVLVQKSGGCFGVLLALIALTGTAICGVVSLFS